MNFWNRLKIFPISFFAMSLGLIGTTLAWQKLEHFFGVFISPYLFVFSILIFLILLIIYGLKIIFCFSDFKKELSNPIKINFFPIIAKFFLISSIILLEFEKISLSKNIWIIGAVLQLIFTLLIFNVWMHKDKFEIKHINPALFIPLVGNIIAPIAGIKHFSPEISWFFFSIGFFLWLFFTSIVINRIIFHDPLERKLLPTFFILMAPPAIGFISYTKLAGELNDFSRILYYFSLFMFLVLTVQLPYFYKLKFQLSFWAYTFPLSAIIVANYLFFTFTKIIFIKYLTLSLLIILSVLVLILLYQTFKNILNQKICVAE